MMGRMLAHDPMRVVIQVSATKNNTKNYMVAKLCIITYLFYSCRSATVLPYSTVPAFQCLILAGTKNNSQTTKATHTASVPIHTYVRHHLPFLAPLHQASQKATTRDRKQPKTSVAMTTLGSCTLVSTLFIETRAPRRNVYQMPVVSTE